MLDARLQLRRAIPGSVGRGRARRTLEPNDLAALGPAGSIQAALGLKDQAARTLPDDHGSRSEINGSSGC